MGENVTNMRSRNHTLLGGQKAANSFFVHNTSFCRSLSPCHPHRLGWQRRQGTGYTAGSIVTTHVSWDASRWDLWCFGGTQAKWQRWNTLSRLYCTSSRLTVATRGWIRCWFYRRRLRIMGCKQTSLATFLRLSSFAVLLNILHVTVAITRSVVDKEPVCGFLSA